jgi:hypothetical protein
MTTKLNFTCAFSFIGSSILSAQSSAVLHTEQLTGLEAFNTVRLLEQNALWVLIGVVVLMSLAWISSVLKACVGLNKPKKSSRRPSMTLLVLILGLSVFCGSCSVEKYRMAVAAEQRTCPLRHHYGNEVNIPFNNRYTSTSYSNSSGPIFCKYCGYMISHGH